MNTQHTVKIMCLYVFVLFLCLTMHFLTWIIENTISVTKTKSTTNDLTIFIFTSINFLSLTITFVWKRPHPSRRRFATRRARLCMCRFATQRRGLSLCRFASLSPIRRGETDLPRRTKEEIHELYKQPNHTNNIYSYQRQSNPKSDPQNNYPFWIFVRWNIFSIYPQSKNCRYYYAVQYQCIGQRIFGY